MKLEESDAGASSCGNLMLWLTTACFAASWSWHSGIALDLASGTRVSDQWLPDQWERRHLSQRFTSVGNYC